MKKILLFAVCFTLFASSSWAAEPLKIEDFQNQQQEIVKMGTKVDAQTAAFQVIIDYAIRQKIASQDLKQKLVDKFAELEAAIKKLKAVPVITPKPAPVEPEKE